MEKRGRAKISTSVIFIRETGNVFIGCELFQHRKDIRLCDLKHCTLRGKCAPYQQGKELKRELGLLKRRVRGKEEFFDHTEKKSRRKQSSSQKFFDLKKPSRRKHKEETKPSRRKNSEEPKQSRRKKREEPKQSRRKRK